MERITNAMLQSRIDYLNEITGSPMEYSTTDSSGKFRANIGNYHLSGAYGGWELQRVNNTSGGVSTPLNTGHISKRELLNLLDAFIKGINTTKE